MSDVYFLLNHRAGRCDPAVIMREARRAIWGFELKFLCPDNREELAAMVRALDPARCRALVVCGGDGTMHLAAQSLAGRKVPLIPMPLGTANDLARALGLDGTWDQLQLVLAQATPTAIDLIRINGIYVATVGGIGVGARLTDEINERRNQSRAFRMASELLREQIYTFMSAKTIMLKQALAHRVRVRAPGLNEEVHTAVLMACNQSSLGKDMVVAPQARNDDGVMDIFIGDVASRQDLLKVLYDIKRGRPNEMSRLFRASELIIESLDHVPIPLFGDGERLPAATKIEFKLQAKALTVLRADRGLAAWRA